MTSAVSVGRAASNHAGEGAFFTIESKRLEQNFARSAVVVRGALVLLQKEVGDFLVSCRQARLVQRPEA